MRLEPKLTRTVLAATVAIGALATGGLGYATSAAAAAAATDTATEVKEVVVTANKREEKLKDVANSITAIGGDQLDTRELRSFSEFQHQVPGLTVAQTGAAFTKLVIRGQNSGGTGAVVASTIDDIPFSFSGAIGNGAYLSADIDTTGMNRVEVLRGPQGTLYGAAAEAGIVKYYTKAPNTHTFSSEFELGGRTVDGGGWGDDGKMSVNVPLLQDKLAVRATFFRDNSPGYVNLAKTNQSDFNQIRKEGARFALLYTPTTDLSFKLSYLTQDSRIRGDEGVEIVGDLAATPDAGGNLVNPANAFNKVNGNTSGYPFASRYVKRYNVFGLEADYDLHWAKFESITSYGNVFTHDRVNVAAYLPNGLSYEDLFAFYAGKPVYLLQDQKEALHKYSQEFRLSSEPNSTTFGLPFDWQGGLFATREVEGFDQPYELRSQADFSPVPTLPLGRAQLPNIYKEWAAFGEVTYHFTPKFDISLGGRHTSTTQDFRELTYAGFLYPTTSVLVAPEATEDSNTYSFSPRYHIDDNSIIYARIASGFRPGGPQTPIPNPPAGYPTSFQSDSTVNYEVGYRNALFDKTLTLDLTAYHVDWTRIQLLQTVTTTNGQQFNVTGNGGQATSDGIEYNITWRPIHNLELGLLGSFLEAKLTTNAPGLNAVKGEKLPNVPWTTSTFNADYHWAALADYDGFVGGSLIYVGDQHSSVGKSPSQISAGFDYRNNVVLPATTELDLHAGLRNGHYTFETYVKNLTNENKLTSYSYSGPARYGIGFFQTPRVIGFVVKSSY